MSSNQHKSNGILTTNGITDTADDIQSQISALLSDDTQSRRKAVAEEEEDESTDTHPLLNNHNNFTQHHHQQSIDSNTNGIAHNRTRSLHRSPLEPLYNLTHSSPSLSFSSLLHQMSTRIIPIIAVSLLFTIIYLSSQYLITRPRVTPIIQPHIVRQQLMDIEDIETNTDAISKTYLSALSTNVELPSGLKTLYSCMKINSSPHRLALIFSSSSDLTPGIFAFANFQSEWCVAVIAPAEEEEGGHYPQFQQSLISQYNKTASNTASLDTIRSRLTFIDKKEQSLLPYSAASQQNLAYLLGLDLHADIIVELSPSYTYNPITSHTQNKDFPIDYAVNTYPLAPAITSGNASVTNPHEFFSGTDHSLKYTPPPHNKFPLTTCVPIIQHILVQGGSNANTETGTDPLSYPTLAVDSGVLTPLTTFSNIYLSPAFFSLYLPTSHSPSFNQIIRSYVTQTLLSYLHTPTHPYSVSSLVSDRVSNEVKQNWGDKGGFRNRGSLHTSHAEPCVIITPPYLTDNITTLLSSSSYHSTISSEEQASLENLLVLLIDRRKGGSEDLQIRTQNRYAIEKHNSTIPILITDILLLLYNDLIINNILPSTELDSLQHYLIHYVHLHSHSRGSTLSPLLQYLPFRQSVFGVCINFNFYPNYNSLLQVLHYHTMFSRDVAVVFPVKKSSLGADVATLMNKFNHVKVIECEESNKGFYMTWCIMHCLEYYSQIIDNQKDKNSATSLQGILWTADDMYFNFTLLFPPTNQMPEPNTPLYSTSNDLTHTHLTFPFDEFWFSPTDDIEDLQKPMDMLCECTGKDNQFRDQQWVWLTKDKNDFKNLKQLYQQWPNEWKQCLANVRGGTDKQGVVLTNAVADLIYIPNHYNAIPTMLSTFKTLYQYKDQFPVFGEVLVPILIDITMCLIGRPTISPSLERENLGIFWSDALAGKVSKSATPRAPNKDTTLFYSFLIKFMNNYQNNTNTYNSALPYRPRPVPLRRDGYRWDDREDWELMQWMIDIGEPPFLHAFKLSAEESPATRMWRDANEKLLVKLIQNRLEIR